LKEKQKKIKPTKENKRKKNLKKKGITFSMIMPLVCFSFFFCFFCE